MNSTSIVAAFSKRKKGQFARIVMERPAAIRKTLAAEAGVIVKRTALTVQLCDYANRGPIKQAVESGEREAPCLPSWVVSTESLPNGLKFWRHASGQQYLAAPLVGSKSAAQWTRNGKKVSLSEIAHFLLASETAKKEAGEVPFVAIKVENILTVG